MATTQNMPHRMGGGEHEHPRPIYMTGNRSGPAHRLRTDPYEYNSASNNVPPAGEFLRAPVCCSECEDFWKALILEVDQKHTSRVPAGKASLVMAKGASGSVLQIKSSKQTRTRFFSALGCKSSGDAFHITSCQPRVSSLRDHQKLNIATPMRSNHAYVRQFEVQESRTVGYNAQKHDVISTPRRQMYQPRTAVDPQPLDQAPILKPIRTHIDRQEERFNHHQRIFTGSQSARCPSYADASHLKPYLRPNPHDEKPSPRVQPREFLSHPSTPRMYTPLSQTPENRVQEFLHRNFPSPTPSSRSRWDTQSTFKDRKPGENSTTSPTTSSRQRWDTQSRKLADSPPTATPSSRQRWNTQSSCRDSTPSPLPKPHDIATATPKPHQLSRTSTIESGYTSLSIPRSTCSASSSEELDSPSAKLAARGRVFHTKTHRPQDLMRNNLSRTSTSASSLMEPIVLFTGHGCRSETDEYSEDDEADVVVTNPSYFKHIIANPNYIKQVIKPQAPTNQVPKDVKMA